MDDNQDVDLHTLLATLGPKARDHLRNVLIRDQADRNAIASQLLRYRDGHGGDDWADIIDMLTMHPEERLKRPAARRDRGRRATLERRLGRGTE